MLAGHLSITAAFGGLQGDQVSLYNYNNNYCYNGQVQSMLEDIGLGNYVTRFAKELIDGSILIDLNEEVLEDELSMQTSSDRQKLMKLINGEEKVKASSKKKLV